MVNILLAYATSDLCLAVINAYSFFQIHNFLLIVTWLHLFTPKMFLDEDDFYHNAKNVVFRSIRLAKFHCF